MSHSFDPAIEFLTPASPRKFPWINVILFALTCLTTWLVGVYLMATFNHTPAGQFLGPAPWIAGVPFSLSIMAIFFSHEMGHYLTARYYGLDVSLPYFIPFPSLVGTMGAFIRIRSPFQDRRSLLEVGVGGPIAGFIVATIVLVLSLGYSRIEPLEGPVIRFGEPLIFKAVQYGMGLIPPAGMDSYLHPVSLAAWFGFLATALNLLPAAQLDGGHIIYAAFGRYHGWISRGVVAVLVPLGIFYWWGWFLWIGLLLAVKLRHPATLDDSVPLKGRHIVLGISGLLLLIVCFMPAPVLGQSALDALQELDQFARNWRQ